MRCHPIRWLWGLIPVAMLSLARRAPANRLLWSAISSSAAGRRFLPPVMTGRLSLFPVATACWSGTPPARTSATRRRLSCAMCGACVSWRRALRCRRPATCPTVPEREAPAGQRPRPGPRLRLARGLGGAGRSRADTRTTLASAIVAPSRRVARRARAKSAARPIMPPASTVHARDEAERRRRLLPRHLCRKLQIRQPPAPATAAGCCGDRPAA